MIEQTKQEFLNEMDCLLRDGKKEQAIKQMNRFIFANDPRVLMKLGNAYIRIEEFELSFQTYTHLLTMDIDQFDKNWIMFNMSIIFRRTKQIERAKKTLHELLKSDLKNPCYLSVLGDCYFDSQKYELAEKYFMDSIKNINNAISKSDINKKTICAHAAWFFKETGKIELAIDLYKKALAYFPTDKERLLQLGDCYSEIGNSEEAKETYMKVKEYYPNDDIVTITDAPAGKDGAPVFDKIRKAKPASKAE